MKRDIPVSVFCLCALLFSCINTYAQSGAVNPAKRPNVWWQADWEKNSIPCINLDEAYNYLKGRKSKQVIVAIIDNCIITAHDDLKDCI